MENLRGLLSGIIVWALIFLSFTIMSFIPVLQNSTELQNGLILLLLIPFVILSLRYFYKHQSKLHGLYIGLTVIVCCLLLDAIITLPFVIIPKGGTYLSFYTDPGLAIMGIEILLVSYLYWKIKIEVV